MTRASTMSRLLKIYGLLALGAAISMFSVFGIAENGFSLAGGGNPGQVDGGLFPFLLILGLAIMVYGLFEKWLNRK